MAEALILEFDGVGREQYDAVNKRLGIDMASGEGDWPEGMLSHTAGAKADGWVVFEVWESRGAQGQFMNERLGQALQEGGITEPPARVEWIDVVSNYSPGAYLPGDG